MEDVKAYIKSGILELYVLGDLPPKERLQVEEMMRLHPAVKAGVMEIERTMEMYAAENAVEPSENLRDRILNSMVVNLADDRVFTAKEVPVKDNVVPMLPAWRVEFYKYAFAACLALLVASIFALISVYNKWQNADRQLVAMNNANQKFTQTVNYMDRQLDMLRDTSYKIIKLKGMPEHASAHMLVAFSPAKKKVMIDMGGMALPVNDHAHQYQLWAIVNKKPVSLGVFDKTSADTADIKEMKHVALAQAFAVTLEPRGGSINPTMDQMMVTGSL